jgi:hypothetical protein
LIRTRRRGRGTRGVRPAVLGEGGETARRVFGVPARRRKRSRACAPAPAWHRVCGEEDQQGTRQGTRGAASARAAVHGKGSRRRRLPPNLPPPNAHHGPRCPSGKKQFLSVQSGAASPHFSPRIVVMTVPRAVDPGRPAVGAESLRRFRPAGPACRRQAGRAQRAQVAGTTGSYRGRGGPGDAACLPAGRVVARSQQIRGGNAG